MSFDTQALDSQTPPDSLCDFQQQFGQYLRGNLSDLSTDNHADAQAGYSHERVTRLYQSLVFNNICGFLDKCFPVCQSLMTPEAWRDVCQCFFAQHACQSPYFTQINCSFVEYLALPDTLTQLDLPPYFAQLAHYEWIELYVDIHHADTSTPQANASITEDGGCSQTLHNGCDVWLNPTLQNLHYQWAVQTISADYRPTTQEDSFVLVYRTVDNHQVKFMRINALTHALVDFIQVRQQVGTLPQDTRSVLLSFAESLGFEDGAALLEFGASLFDQLYAQQVLLSVQSTNKD